MPFTDDPEVGAGLAALFAAAGDEPLPAVGDVATRRRNVETLQTAIHAQLPAPADATIRDFEATTDDGAAGVSAELHVHPDVPHAFEALVPTAAISLRSAADRRRVLGRL